MAAAVGSDYVLLTKNCVTSKQLYPPNLTKAMVLGGWAVLGNTDHRRIGQSGLRGHIGDGRWYMRRDYRQETEERDADERRG